MNNIEEIRKRKISGSAVKRYVIRMKDIEVIKEVIGNAKKYKLNKYDIIEILESTNDKELIKEVIEKAEEYGLEGYDVSDLIIMLEDKNAVRKAIIEREKYKLSNDNIEDMIEKVKDISLIIELLQNPKKYKLEEDTKICIINSACRIQRNTEIIIELLEMINYNKESIQVLEDVFKSNSDFKVMEKYKTNEETIGLPKELTIGIEIETEGELSRLIRYRNIMDNWEVTSDGSVPDGVEIISPILHDDIKDLEQLEIICNVLQKMNFITTPKCGGHIHFGASYLENDAQAQENLMTIWNECEEIFYKMSNAKGEVPRKKIVKWAKTSHSEIENIFQDGNVKISDEQDFREVILILTHTEKKSKGLNLGHYGEEDKNTFEVRTPNGTLNCKVIKENIKLFGSIFKISKEMSENPGYKKVEFTKLKNRNLTEREKVEALLNLLFDNEKEKIVYRERWDSVKDEKIFDELVGDGKQTFKRKNYQFSSEGR